jgi:hypothetical protein
MADNTRRIAEIREILRTGVVSSNVDGTSMTIDPESLRKELRQLTGEDDTQRLRRPRLSTVNLQGLR